MATLLAVALRGNFDTVEEALIASTPYIAIFLGSSCVVFLVGGLDRTPWRYTSVADHLQIIVLTALAILLALVFTFATNRLGGIARTLPALQAGFIVIFLVCARCIARFWSAKTGAGARSAPEAHIKGDPHETVLVAGVNTLSELFIHSVQEFAAKTHVAGLLAEDPDLRGRVVHKKPILGTIGELWKVLESLEVHGVLINRIVVAMPAQKLSAHALKILMDLEISSDIVVEFLSERLGFETLAKVPSTSPIRAGTHSQAAFVVTEFSKQRFWLVKRTIDCCFAGLLIAALAPVMTLVAFVVALDVGFPVIFWQQRPGLYGRPFKLYKFRTMSASHDKRSRRVPDDERVSTLGNILRRIRLDELPQLYNVLIGEMSFIGPRPLLPRDQSSDFAARLLIRPGITGWAQVNGGRIISALDKWILDLWYVQNASFLVDFKIVLRTVQMILFGDRIDNQAVYRARSSLDPSLTSLAEMTPAE
jgi:lipopolysaccharide/colanic/teichoic acid biosynthesis glycosyltransferase